MGLRFVLSLTVLFFLSSLLQARDFLLPHVANGVYPGGSVRMTFVLFNPTDAVVSVEITLTRDDGTALTVTIPELGTGSSFSLVLQSGETRLLQTDGSGSLVAGAAKVVATGDIGVSGIFTLLDTAGNFQTEAGIGSSEPLTEFVIPVDARGSSSTAIALFNFGTKTVTASFSLRDTSGEEKGTASRTLAPGEHVARFVIGEIITGISDFQGTLVIRVTGPVAALVLRQNASPLSFTTLPVVPLGSVQLTFNLPQLANGTFAGGSIRTSFIIFSISAASTTVTLTLTKDDGSAFPVTIPGQGAAGTFTITIPAGGHTLGAADAHL